MAKLLKVDNDFTPCSVSDGDEVFENGIFEFKTTKMIEYIQENPVSSINESHLDSVEISKPVILAEIAPGRYKLIDGNHRLEKRAGWE